MATDRHTLESLEIINEAIKMLIKEHKKLAHHIREQKKQIAWDTDNEGNSIYRPYEKS